MQVMRESGRETILLAQNVCRGFRGHCEVSSLSGVKRISGTLRVGELTLWFIALVSEEYSFNTELHDQACNGRFISLFIAGSCVVLVIEWAHTLI